MKGRTFMHGTWRAWSIGLSVAALSAVLGGCAAKGSDGVGAGGAGGAGAGGAGAAGGSAPSLLGSLGAAGDPMTCGDAQGSASYIGCDFWPVVTFNPVWSIFDFAVIVSNVGADPATVTITGPGGVSASGTVAPLGLQTFYLPWVPALKGGDSDVCGQNVPDPGGSVVAPKGAYHLASTRPVVVYQFNALEFRGTGGPAGKDWSSCPGDQVCPKSGTPNGCFSYSNDASLLLPTTAMTGNYRITALQASAGGSFFAVTGTADGTTVKVKLSSTAYVRVGGGIAAGAPGDEISFPLSTGDVAEVVADDFQAGADLSGSQVQADHPVQVIAGAPCASLPSTAGAGVQLTCDHLEETVLPSETLGHHYFVTVPTAPLGAPVGHVVRFYGNVDGTHLTYPSGAPASAPATIDAGQVIDLGVVKVDFEVSGDHELAVGTFSLSGAEQDPNDIVSRGDPAQSQAVAVEQYRKSYVFLAPNDYDESYIDVVLPMGASVKLDGAPLPGAPAPLGTSSFGVARARLGAGQAGAHVVTSDQPIGIQIMGYGAYTSYQYPGGLNLQHIAPPPPPLK